MAYKVFTAGEEALATDLNTLLMSQTVARFATAAARSTALTAPVLNQLSMRDDRTGAIERWNGSAWVDVGSLSRFLHFASPSGYLGAGSALTSNINITLPTAGILIVSASVALQATTAGAAGLVQVLPEFTGSVSGVVGIATPQQMPATGGYMGLPCMAKCNAAAGTIGIGIRLSNSPAGGPTVQTFFWSGVATLIPSEIP
jgi:hypothetical protein